MRRSALPVLRVSSRSQGQMRIRITKAGVGVVILQRSEWLEGDVLTVPKEDGNYLLHRGFAELVEDEPAQQEGTSP